MKPELTKKLADMAEQLKAISAELSEQSFTPVIGGWYLADGWGNTQYKIKLSRIKNGIFSSDLYFKENGSIVVGNDRSGFSELIRPLTQEEVKELLVNECKRKFEGKVVQCLLSEQDRDYLNFEEIYDYNSERDTLWIIGKKGKVIKVYGNGKFADIVEDVMKVGGVEVKINVTSDCISIGHGYYNKNEVMSLKAICTWDHLKLNWHGEDVTPEKLDQILKLFK